MSNLVSNLPIDINQTLEALSLMLQKNEIETIDHKDISKWAENISLDSIKDMRNKIHNLSELEFEIATDKNAYEIAVDIVVTIKGNTKC